MNLVINWDVSPEIIDGWRTPNLYGLLFVTGLIIGYFVIKRMFKKEQIDKYDKRTLMIHKTAQSEEFKDWCESCVDYLLLRLVILDKKIECIDKTLLDMIQTLPNVVTETISF